MKFTVSLFLCLTTLLNTFSQANNRARHSLIFAIGDYPESGGWPRISSNKDVPYIKKALLTQGFPDKNILVIEDSGATLNGIRAAFDGLISRVNPGDIVVIHFSCHGEQVEADNQNKIDGLDECVVTYNCVVPRLSKDFNKDQAEYLRGHILGAYLKQLRTKLGPGGDVAVFMDFCHSGGGTRGNAKIRGGQPPFVSSGYDPGKHRNSDSSLLAREEMNSSRGDANSLAPYEVISATRPEELDMETVDDKGEGIGSLTYAISKSFEKLEPGTTYRALFAKIQTIMNQKVPSQHPLLEGNGIDRLLLGGEFIHQQPYIELSKIERPNQVILKAGTMAGLTAGAKVSLYTSGTTDSSKGKRIASGTVTNAELYLSTLLLDRNINFKRPAELWAFISEQVYKVPPIVINLQSAVPEPAASVGYFTATEAAKIRANLKNLPLVIFGKDPELLIEKGKGEDLIRLASSGYIFSKLKTAVDDSAALIEQFQRYAQYKFLLSLDVKDPKINVNVKLIPVINRVADTNSLYRKSVNGIYEFYENDTVTIWIKNAGLNSVYVNILDLQPDGIINAVLPYKDKSIYPQDLKIKAGEQYIFPIDKYSIVLSPPYGTEVFKIFASAQEIDVEQIANTKGEGTRGSLSVLESLLKNSYAMRGAGVNNISKAEGSTANVIFTIKPRR